MDIRATILEVMAKRNITIYGVYHGLEKNKTPVHQRTVYGFLKHGKSIQHTGLERILDYLKLEIKE